MAWRDNDANSKSERYCLKAQGLLSARAQVTKLIRLTAKRQHRGMLMQ